MRSNKQIYRKLSKEKVSEKETKLFILLQAPDVIRQNNLDCVLGVVERNDGKKKGRKSKKKC